MSADHNQVVEEFPRPPAYYKRFDRSGSLAAPELGPVRFHSLYEEIYESAYSEAHLPFVKAASDVVQSNLQKMLLKSLDHIVQQAGNIMNQKSVVDHDIEVMMTGLHSSLTEMHSLLAACREKEAKVSLLVSLKQKQKDLQALEVKLSK